jgi:hypothetical protein
MRRQKSTRSHTDDGGVLPSTEPHVIDLNAIYTLRQARLALDLKKSTLPREARLGRLRVSRRGGRYFVTGAWLLDWIKGGAVSPRRHAKETDVDPQALAGSATRNGHSHTAPSD